ncbi:MAG: hypothetical protein L0Y66_10910 [Myxococcaceae bacterium]|nr:hypothetical protein [Myxococcaceae bacterium]MCI0671646.1 hypothetical protein [Myxococcaceae bacterium]
MAVKPLDPKTADKRTAERYVRSGQLDEKAYERHLKDLPDVAAKAAPVETRMLDVPVEEAEADEGEELGSDEE